jgi:hypothetical protein
MNSTSHPATATAELRLARQIVRLFKRPQGVVWELIPAPAQRQADDLTLRDADGTLIAYARPEAR